MPRFRFWMSYVSRNGKGYGAGVGEGHAVHTRGWHVGVKVVPRILRQTTTGQPDDRDAFDVYVTSGSSQGGKPDVHVGRVASTPDGPRFFPRDGYGSEALQGKV